MGEGDWRPRGGGGGGGGGGGRRKEEEILGRMFRGGGQDLKEGSIESLGRGGEEQESIEREEEIGRTFEGGGEGKQEHKQEQEERKERIMKTPQEQQQQQERKQRSRTTFKEQQEQERKTRIKTCTGSGGITLHGWRLPLQLPLLLLLLTAAWGSEAVTSQPQRMKGFLEYPYPAPPSTVAPCLGPEHINRDIKPQHLYVNEREQALTMLTSPHVPHQLMTRIVAIFLKEWLGYVNLSIITQPETFDPWKVVEQMKPDRTHLAMSKSSMEVQIPEAMVNLKVWVPPGYNLEPITTEFDTSSYLGSGGRFGWFLPASLLDSNTFILEHWRSFITKDSPALRIFHRTPEELKTLSHKVRDPVSQEYYCPDDLEEEVQCNGGIFSPPWCQASSAICAVLFTSKADSEIASFLHTQILTMRAYVRVAYIGPHLDHSFLEANLRLPGQGINRSVLVFHWWPSVLLQPFNFTSVSFPPCIDSSQVSGSPSTFFQCKYEMHPFHKFVWKKLERYAKFAYEALHMVQVSNLQFSEVLDIYNTWGDIRGPDTLDQVACSWMKKNKVHWEHWHSGRILHELRLVGLFPILGNETERFKFLAPGAVAAYFMAVEAVNKNTSILKDYKIRSIVLNGACNSAIVMRKFIQILQRSSSQGFYNTMIGFVGPACSDTIEPIAGVSKYFNIPIISYAAEGAIFSGQDDYPYFFRTIPENRIFGYVYKHLFRSMGWRRIASLVEEGHRYSEYLTVLEELLQEHNMTLDKKEFSDERKTSDVISKLQMLKKEKYRIIIGNFYQDVACEVLCGASHLGMTGKEGYLWFLPHWFTKNWYDTDALESNSNCSTEQMSAALEGHMSLSYRYFAEDSQIMQTGQTVSEWKVEYTKAIKEYDNVAESDYAGFTYDAVWVYALALDKLFKEDPSYAADLRATNTTQAFIKKISGTSFNGVSGHINFNADRSDGGETRNSRLTDIIVWQFQSGEYVKVATYHPKSPLADLGELHIYKDRFTWPSGMQPDDGSEKCVVEGFRNFLNLTCTQAVVVLCTICFGSLTLVLLVCFFLFKRRYEKKLEKMQELWRGRPLFEIFDGWEIPRDKVVINRKLGEGAFGTVYGGECLFDSQGWVAVAVKTLKLGSTISEKLDFLSEAEMMKNFEHENIVHLLGVCTKTEPIYTVMEFMLYGDLKTYLLARRNLVNEKSRNDDDEVSNKRLTSMAVDIARGLAYLAQMKYVHRDVACRNCLVNANRTVKLADFGMTRPMYENNYYKFHRKGMLPVRWMAPESLTEGVFTTMSDIWSYGVLLYEIVTFGAFPFQGLTNDQVLEHVKAGHTIAIPRGVKPQLDMLLRLCWHRAPSRRPPIHQIIEQLTNHPRLISPCLDSPQSSVQCEDTRSLEIIPDKTRKSSLSINHRLQNMALPSSRRRSMSGNMVMNVPPLTTSLSEDGMIVAAHSNLDALNLNHVMLEEGEPGEDPLLPPAQYVSSRYVSLAHKEQHKERESLVGGHEGDYCTTDISRDLWTNVTPV